MQKELYDPLIYKVIVRFSNYVHFLPASERDHHQASGGLLHHSLEVAKHALISAEKLKPYHDPSLRNNPTTRINNHYVWRLCVFYGALLHDIGKIQTDMLVTSGRGNEEWDPLVSSLYQWCLDKNLSKYYISYRIGRFGKHAKASIPFFERIVGPNIRHYLNNRAEGMLDKCINAVTEIQPHPFFSELINDADTFSAQENARKYSFNQAVDQATTPVAEHVRNAIEHLISSETWDINCQGATVFVSNHGMFIGWKHAPTDIIKYTRKIGQRGIPTQPKSLASLLVQRGLAEPLKIGPDEYHLWTIYPECLKYENGKEIKVNALKIKSPTIFFTLSEMPEKIKVRLHHEPKENDETSSSTEESSQIIVMENEPEKEKLNREKMLSEFDDVSNAYEQEKENPTAVSKEESQTDLFQSQEMPEQDPFGISTNTTEENHPSPKISEVVADSENISSVSEAKNHSIVNELEIKALPETEEAHGSFTKVDETDYVKEKNVNLIPDIEESDEPFTKVDETDYVKGKKEIELTKSKSNSFEIRADEGIIQENIEEDRTDKLIQLINNKLVTKELLIWLKGSNDRFIKEQGDDWYFEFIKVLGDGAQRIVKEWLEQGLIEPYEGNMSRYQHKLSKNRKAVKFNSEISALLNQIEAVKRTELKKKIKSKPLEKKVVKTEVPEEYQQYKVSLKKLSEERFNIIWNVNDITILSIYIITIMYRFII